MVRLLIDENIAKAVVRGALSRQPDLDVVRVQDVGLRTTADEAILEWAASEGRVVVSRDRNTLIGSAYARVIAGQPMPGVLMLTEGISIGQAVEALLIAALCSTPEDWQDQVRHLP